MNYACKGSDIALDKGPFESSKPVLKYSLDTFPVTFEYLPRQVGRMMTRSPVRM